MSNEIRYVTTPGFVIDSMYYTNPVDKIIGTALPSQTPQELMRVRSIR